MAGMAERAGGRGSRLGLGCSFLGEPKGGESIRQGGQGRDQGQDLGRLVALGRSGQREQPRDTPKPLSG
jgi:hypothetical protein